MIRKIALAAILFVLSGSAANAAVICTLSARDIAFGEVTKVGLTEVGAIVVACIGTGNANYVIALSTGRAGVYTPRAMGSDANTLPYNLYSQTSLSSIWGNGTGQTVVVTGTVQMRNNLLVTFSVPVYGRIENIRNPAPGNYTDSITATMTYSGPTATGSFQVTAHISPQCTISATDLNFGSYTQAQLDGQSQIQVSCTDTTSWNIGLDGGKFPGGTTARRSMAGPGLSQLDYQLYSNSARTIVWGNDVGRDTVPGISTGVPQTLPVFGRISSGERVRDGGYKDTITATLTF